MDASWILSKFDFRSQGSTNTNKENISNNGENSSFCLSNTNSSLQPSNPNISFSSYGILAAIHTNGTASANTSQVIDPALLKNSNNGGNDSFDCDKIKLDVYEKSIQKLANENKSLRKRVKKLTELARTKEEQLIEAFNQACEEKCKNEEKNQLEHNAQLQSYYECFLQIEKENDTLKAKVEQMREKMNSLTAQSNVEQIIEIRHEDANEEPEQNENESQNDESHEVDEKKQEALNKLSLKHIDEELTSVNQSIHLFIEEKKEFQKQSGDENINNDKELTLNKERIRELELEKEALNKKLVSIEASLARWIFRACDYKSDLSKLNEKWSSSEQVINELTQDLAESNKNLDQTRTKLNELTHSLDIHVRQVSELTALNKELELELESLRVVPKETIDVHTQTSVEPQPGRLVGAKTSGLVAQTAAKLHQLIHSTSLEKDELRKEELTTKPTQSTSSSSLETAAGCNTKRIETLMSEINQLKTKLDTLILEKNAYKCKNDELLSDLNSLKQTMTPVVSPQLFSQATKATNTGSKYEARSTQTHSNAKHTSSTQTSTQISELTTASSTTSTSNLVNTNNAKIEQLRKDLDCMRLKLTKEQNDLNAQIDEKNTELKRLEDTIKHLLKQIEDLNVRLNESVASKDVLAKSHEEQLAKLNGNFKIEKQISDTIIQQQKKLLYYLQMKLNGDMPVESTCEKNNEHHHGSSSNNNNHHQSHGKKFKFKQSKPSHNPLLANLHKTTNQQIINNRVTNSKEVVVGTNKKLNDITSELNSNYEVYSSLSAKNQMEFNKLDKNTKTTNSMALNNNKHAPKTDTQSKQQTNPIIAAAISPPTNNNTRKQIHVFITGLNTCPTYCHVCQQLIPLIAYASKCQLCSFTCHSTCSSSLIDSTSGGISKSKSFKNSKQTTQQQQQSQLNNLHDPLKYCHINYLTNSIDYNNYINKLININIGTPTSSGATSQKSSLLSDYLYINVDNKWKKLWLSLKQDQPQLDLYQTKTNLKPFDSINLINDRVLIETNIKQIKKICGLTPMSIQSLPPCAYSEVNDNHKEDGDSDNIYEELNNEPANLINFEHSSLVILLYNTKLCLKLGFTSFNKKNIWYDALQSSILIGQSISVKKTSSSIINQEQFKFFNANKVLKPFLELCDTVVNSYCFINENLIALACDDGLYAINSLVQNGEETNQTSLVKIESVESAHKLYYQQEFGKLCFIGRKSRQFLSIDLTDLNKSLINYDSDEDRRGRSANRGGDNEDDDEFYDDDEDAKSVQVNLEHILNIDRCHLFECSLYKNGYWYLAVATPEIIFILLFNKLNNKYTMVKTIQTANDSPCICLKFTTTPNINQLIYGCGKEFYKMDMTYLQSSSVLDVINSKKQQQHVMDFEISSINQQPIAVCAIDTSNKNAQAILLCYEEYGLFLVYNFNTQTWQHPIVKQTTKSGSSSSITNPNNNLTTPTTTTNAITNSPYLKWPRGNGLTPLQVEYDSSYLYLFYNDSIVTYSVTFENEQFCVKKCGIAFVYKPKFLSTSHTTNINYLVISNRRPLEIIQQTGSNSPMLSGISGEECANNNDEEDDNDEARSSSTKVNNQNLEHDLNDKICLSYFSPDTN